VIRLDDAELSPGARAEIRTYKREIDRRLRSFLQEGMEDGSIAPCDPKLASFAIAGAINWICMWYKPGGPLSPDQIAASFTATLVNGLRASPQAENRAALRVVGGKPRKKMKEPAKQLAGSN
jgi:hypothetical protein